MAQKVGMERSLRIALVTPFAWDTPSAVNQHVADLAIELKLRGHLPVIVASSDDPHELKRMGAHVDSPVAYRNIFPE